MNISTTDAQGLFTKELVDVYKDRKEPHQFLASFFPKKETSTLEISLEVSRGTEKIAADVLRGTDGNRNVFSKSTEKIFIPPYFREYFDITSLDFYDRLFGATEISDSMFAEMLSNGADKMQVLVDKINRTYELQRAQVLTTGIVTLIEGAGQIDFRRRAASLVDLGAGNYFASANNSPWKAFSDGAYFLRTQGKSAGFTFNGIFGDLALQDLYANAEFKTRINNLNNAIDTIKPPQANSVGAVYHGTITAGAYRINLWSYPETYQDDNLNYLPYLDPKKVIMLPETPRFKMVYAAVPQLLVPGQPVMKGDFIFSDYTDEKKRTKEYHVESAGLPVPVAVDQIYTFKAVA